MANEFFITGASHEEAEAMVKRYHYSRRMSANVQHIYAIRKRGGLFGDYGEACAVAVFSIPPTRWTHNVLELSRLVRTPDCDWPLSALLSGSCSHLKKNGHCLLVSFADHTQGHHGGIYQASGWRYHAKRERRMDGVFVDGEFVPGRSANSRWGTSSPSKLRELLSGSEVEPHFDEGKFLYWMPLNIAGKTRAKRLGFQSNPYPKPDNAACSSDELVPSSASREHPPEAAPLYAGAAE